MSEPFNQSLYEASVKAFTINGVPEDVAEKASEVIASDDPAQENLGRSTSDQEIIEQAMTFIKKGDK